MPDGTSLQEFISPDNKVDAIKVVNHISLPQVVLKNDTDFEYDADTEANSFPQGRTKQIFKGKGKQAQYNIQTEQSNISSSGVETNQTSRNSTVNSSLSEDETSQSSFLDDEVKKIELFTKFDFSPEKTKELQWHDAQLHGLINYLDSNILPKSQKKARRILLESSDYALIDGLLWHSRVSKSKRTKQLDHYQLVLPDTMIKPVIQSYHDFPMSGHAGITDTLDRIKEQYFFHRMGPIVTDYVRSCPDCQKRKLTKHHTKTGITAFPQPKRPFEVIQADLYGPLPPSGGQCFTYILTCQDMFSRYLINIPIANKDTLSVASGLTQIFTQWGVPSCMISDLGSEFTSKCMKEICRQLHIPQQFTPSYVHSCLGMCERSHKTLAERLSPYVNNKCNNWMDILSSVTFSINQSVNTTTGYSPHEIIFGQRPHFPLAVAKPTDFDTIPVDARTYVRKHAEKLNIIRTEVKENVIKSQQDMLKRANENINPLKVEHGDYVFLLSETAGVGQKLRNKYIGPFVIDRISSPHLVVLRNPDTGICLKTPVHLNRLKMAYVREPQPIPYFMSRVATCENGQQTDAQIDPQVIQNADDKQTALHKAGSQTDEQTVEYTVPDLRRSARVRKPPNRLGMNVNLNNILSSSDGFRDSKGFNKVKRFLAQRPQKDTTEYLVQLRGEPAENAIWVPYSSLNTQAKTSILQKPPPVIINLE